MTEAKINNDHELYELIEDAYRVFSYPKPKSVEVCESCCMVPEIVADFFNSPIRELPFDYLRDWYAAAYSPRGVSKKLWGHFLPRIFEILALDQNPSDCGVELIFQRFETGNPKHWNKSEWDVIDRFQQAILRRSLSSDQICLEEALCMFALGGWNIHDLLAQVLDYPTETLVKEFAKHWGREYGDMTGTPFWESEAEETVIAFYTSRQMYDKLYAFILEEETNTTPAQQAAYALSVIGTNAEWV